MSESESGPILRKRASAASRIPSGRGGRILLLSASTLVGGGLAVAILIVGLNAVEAAWFLLGASAPILVLYVWAWIRVWSVGVVIRDDDVEVTSWFSSERLSRHEVTWWSLDTYTGVFFIAGWPVAGGALEPGMLSVDLADGSRRRLSGTVSLRATVRTQARFLNAWMRGERTGSSAYGTLP